MKTSAATKSAASGSVKTSRPAGERKTARLFTNGASQAVRLPKEFRMEGTEVRIWKEGERVIMEPIDNGWEPLFEALNELPSGFVIERNQPPVQQRDWSISEQAPTPYASRRKKKK